jgi:hypothetical protein
MVRLGPRLLRSCCHLALSSCCKASGQGEDVGGSGKEQNRKTIAEYLFIPNVYKAFDMTK